MLRAYLDICVLIYAVESTPVLGPLVTAKLQAHRDTHQFFVSDIARLECMVGPLRANDASLLQEYAAFFTAMAALDVPSPAFDLAAKLRGAHRLKTPDALHLATAIHHGCDEFWTNDDKLANAAGTLAIRKVV